MAKIILDSEPSWSYNRCPFMKRNDNCVMTDLECSCIGGYYDSINFDFSKCRFCTTLENKGKEYESNE